MTSAPATLVDLQQKLVANLGTGNAGIVGNEEHIKTGGYHIGAASLRAAGMSSDYSLQYAPDRNATHDFACAVDISGSPDLLMTLGNRIVGALQRQDPRVYGRVRGVNAPFGGDPTDRRYETQDPSTPADDHIETSDDRGHIHLEVFRTLVENQAVIDAIYDVLSGGGTAPAGGGTPAPASTNPLHGHAVPAIIARGSGQYLGPIHGPAASHGGYYSLVKPGPDERPMIKLWQQFLIWDGDVPGVTDINSGWADGVYDEWQDASNRATSDATTRYQQKHRPAPLTDADKFGRVYWDDWTTAASL
jgi:hypothetical protein